MTTTAPRTPPMIAALWLEDFVWVAVPSFAAALASRGDVGVAKGEDDAATLRGKEVTLASGVELGDFTAPEAVFCFRENTIGRRQGGHTRYRRLTCAGWAGCIGSGGWGNSSWCSVCWTGGHNHGGGRWYNSSSGSFAVIGGLCPSSRGNHEGGSDLATWEVV